MYIVDTTNGKYTTLSNTILIINVLIYYLRIQTGVDDIWFNYTIAPRWPSAIHRSGIERMSANSRELFIPYPRPIPSFFFIWFNVLVDEFAELKKSPVFLCEVKIHGEIL